MANELGITVQRVKDIALDQFDWYVDHFSRLPSDKADAIRAKVTGKAPTVRPSPPADKTPRPRPVPDGFPRPYLPSPPRPRDRTPWVRIAELPPLEQLFARRYVEEESRVSWKRVNPDRLPPDAHARVQFHARSWGEQFFDDRETTAWLAVGVLDPRTAARCREAEITPGMLLLPFAIPGKAQHEGKLTLKKALDCQAATVEGVRADLVRTGVLPGHAQAS
ncbi:hypothetical protein [Streptacidiphilus sp. P02-A3a]|uniref:hypothetical protein n=1 Tax=Streptacidiphilus sp. P02-A3a TaxID=2704468 RepID=UPI0015FDD848|nr:hypothetical protein [Streptacidiphilus sp. P02-A3a]QMU67093.1 hypothetical protein GXP74_01575 [Streptacidiphilus sp. P02-A3a]